MKSLQTTLIAVLASFLLAPGLADAGKPKAPPWYLAAPPGCAGGTAPLSLGREMAKDQASLAAQSTLSAQIQVDVRKVVDTAMSSNTENGRTDSSASTTSISKSITETSLMGARIRTAEETKKEIFVLVCIDPEGLTKALEEVAYLEDTLRGSIITGVRNTYADQGTALASFGF